MIKKQIFKTAVILAFVSGFVASQTAQAGGSDSGNSPKPCPPPIIVCNPAPQSGHNYCTPTPPKDKPSSSCNLFQSSVILLLTQGK